MRLHEATSLIRRLDPSLPSNRLSLVAGACFFVGGVVTPLVAGDVGLPGALAGGFGAGVGAFLAWAIGRELDPDRTATARYAVFVYALLVWLGPPSLIALAALLAAARVVLRPTGLPVAWLDVVGAVGLGVGAAWLTPAGAPAGFAVAAAMAIDYRLPGEGPPALQAVAVPLAVVAVIAAATISGNFLGAWRAPTLPELGALAAGLAATTQLGPERVRSLADATRARLVRSRLARTRQLVVAVVAGTVLWAGADGVGAVAPALAATIGTGLVALVRRVGPAARRLGSGALLMAATLLLAACGSVGQPDGPDPTRSAATANAPAAASEPREATEAPTATANGTGTSSAAPDPSDLPQDPQSLAATLARAERSIRDPGLPASGLTRWAHVQQAAYRLLSRRPALREPTRAAMPPGMREAFDRNLRATVELRGLTEPQTELPDWTIVEPPRPEVLRDAYEAAAEAFGLHWSHLAAIHLVETRMGRIHGTSSAGARGPMQFLPSTWEEYGAGDITDPHDAIRAAARYLADHGAPEDMHAALYAYNPSERYVRAILDYAAVMRADPVTYRAYHQWQVYYRLRSGDRLLEEGWSRGE